MSFVSAVGGVGLAALGLFSLHQLWILAAWSAHRRRPPRPIGTFDPWPAVTVQLPVYNEPYVVERLLEAVARLDYPTDRLEIQVLDDSTDETTRLVAARLPALQAQGLRVRHLRRPHRNGFKAGALADALPMARGEFVAVFDADFVPPTNFLHQVIPHFADPAVGMVQARWGHLNRQDSFLTRAQALMLDGHFFIEQAARSRSGRFFNFNGSAGVWRRRAILDAGGWQPDTLTEDLDLSYRAQLAGWRFIYLDDVVVPAELPTDIPSLKAQQHRWTKGSIQAARKLLPRVWRSRQPWAVKLEASFHFGGWLHYPLGLLAAMLTLPMLAVRGSSMGETPAAAWPGWVGVLLIGTTALFYGIAHRLGKGAWWRLPIDLFGVMVVSAGLALNNTRAIWEVVRGIRSPFHRTPKYCGQRALFRNGRARPNPAGASGGWVEAVVGIYLCVALAYAASQACYAVLPFLLPVSAGFLYAGLSAVAPEGLLTPMVRGVLPRSWGVPVERVRDQVGWGLTQPKGLVRMPPPGHLRRVVRSASWRITWRQPDTPAAWRKPPQHR